jgi:hypothetical protein
MTQITMSPRRLSKLQHQFRTRFELAPKTLSLDLPLEEVDEEKVAVALKILQTQVIRVIVPRFTLRASSFSLNLIAKPFALEFGDDVSSETINAIRRVLHATVNGYILTIHIEMLDAHHVVLSTFKLDHALPGAIEFSELNYEGVKTSVFTLEFPASMVSLTPVQ